MIAGKWTPDRDDIVRALWPDESAVIAAMPEPRTNAAIRHRARKLGLPFGAIAQPWTDGELDTMREWYAARTDRPLELDTLASTLGRSRASVACKANDLGIAMFCRKRGVMDPPRKYSYPRQRMFETAAERNAATGKRIRAHFQQNGHPRGMLGKHHPPESMAKRSEKMRTMAAMGMLYNQRFPMSQEQRDAMSRAQSARLRAGGNPYSRTKSGRREDLENRFFRSSWEANYARFLNLLKSQGVIVKWDFECDTFWFEAIRRGVRSYTPDFKIWEPNGNVYYVEVKGWMDPKSKTKIKRMKKYHPDVELRVVGRKAYREIEKKLGGAINGWEKAA